MDIQIKGHHIEITEPLREKILEKLAHLEKFDSTIVNIEVILMLEKAGQTASATVHIPHNISLHAEATSDDMYTSIDELQAKLIEQVSTHKKKQSSQYKHSSNKRESL